MSFPNELQYESTPNLLFLMEVYSVPHNGTPLESISKWLQPKITPLASNPIKAIQEGRSFDLNSTVGKDIIDSIFENQIPVANGILEDFSLYPMLPSSWDLLLGYIRSEDRLRYFQEFTGVNPDKFLNHTERIFYLTRGYGRPNKNISMKEAQLRSIYIKTAPTSLIALSDIFGVCATSQNPNLIRERLSDIDLRSIDSFHQNAVIRINQCFKSDLTAVDPGCFQKFLTSIGALTLIEYDPIYDVFISNISQLDEYGLVIPDKKWSYAEVQNLPDVYVKSIIQTLPDEELLSIQIPSGIKYEVELKKLSKRLRSELLNGATRFLTQKDHRWISRDEIQFGRLVDKSKDIMTPTELIQSVQKYGALIDPYGNVISLSTAIKLNSTLQNEILNDVILKTRARISENWSIIRSIDKSVREKLYSNFQAWLDQGLEVNDLQSILTPTALRLILWSRESGLALNFEEYFKYWAPIHKHILEDTLKYYIPVLSAIK